MVVTQTQAMEDVTTQLESIPRSLHNRKEALLARLNGSGRSQYKRYVGSPLRYAGGKSLAVGHIIEHFPTNIGEVVSPFLGGGSVEIAIANELGVPVKAYDIFDILTNYWEMQLVSPIELAQQISQWDCDKATYKEVKERLKAHWQSEATIKRPLELAAHYWFNHNLSYGPGFLGWMSKIYEQPLRYERLLNKVRDFRCLNLSVGSSDFEKTLLSHPRAFLYCDPPYYLEGDSKMFRGIYPQRNFPVHHKDFDHSKLRDLLHAHSGGFILSYNDCSTIRKWYSDFRIVEVGWQYTLGQGETRIGFNRINNGAGHIKKSHELLIIKEHGYER